MAVPPRRSSGYRFSSIFRPFQIEFVLAGFVAWAGLPAAKALEISDYSPEVNGVFAGGFPNAPVRNESSNFLGADFDLSGVGWVDGLGTPETDRRMHNVTMISPIHFAAAKHNLTAGGLFNITVGTQINFASTDNELLSTSVSSVNSNLVTGATANDLAVGTLSTGFTPADGVASYRILDVANLSYSGMSMLIYGSQPDGSGSRVGTATAGTVSGANFAWTSSGAPGSAAYWQGGDSSSPAFLVNQSGNGSGELTLAGTAWFPTGAQTNVRTAGLDPITPVNDTLKATGYALKMAIYHNPADAARTAPRWTGGAGTGDISANGNWSSGVVPSGLPIVFDAAQAGGQTNLQLGSAFSTRGMLFTDAPAGFVFEGAGGLTVGYTGIRNESSATQTFRVPITLAGSQNWEAANGGLIFEGTVNTGTGHLVVVGGAGNTRIDGTISGAGSLGKDDSGTLVLTASNSYLGKTFLHNGTIRLEGSGNLAATELAFVAGSTGTLDLNGRNQTLTNITSSYGATGRILLGGSTLTVQSATTGTYLGTLEGPGDVVKGGAGLGILSGSSSFSGTLRVDGGVLRAGSSTALSPNAAIRINGGVLELAAGDLQTTLGTGAGQLSFSGSGGFSARDADRRVSLGSSVTWNTGGFVPAGNSLVLSSTAANATLDFQSSINLNAGTRVFYVENGSARVDARLSGSLSNGSIIKTGVGTLELSGSNGYTGSTTLYGGGLLLTSEKALGSGNLVFGGGIVVLGSGDFTRSLGTGAGQVHFAGNGGFGAFGADRIVNIGGDGQTLVWGTGSFLPSGSVFTLSLNSADATVDVRNPIDFNGAARTIGVTDGLAAVDARLSGALTNGSLIKTGSGVLELAAANSYTGQTQVNGGALLLSSAGALGTGNLSLNTGVLLLGAGNYTATTGSGAGQVQFAGSGGFGAVGATRSVSLGSSVTWGTGNFVAAGSNFILSHSAANATVDFTSAINLNGASRTIQVNQGSAAIDARLSGNLSNGGLIKAGAGTLELTGSNSYAGETLLSAGTLRLGSAQALSATSNLNIAGGVIDLAAGNFTRAVGTGAGQIQFTGSGGFSASGATRYVNLGGAGAMVTWGTGGFLPTGSTLILSSADSNATIDFQNNLRLGASGIEQRTIQVENGSAAIDARLSGGMTPTASSTFHLAKTGAGTLELSGNNTFYGGLMVNAGTVLVSGSLLGVHYVSVAEGATFRYTGGSALTREVRLGGGSFVYDSAAAFTGTLDFQSGLIGGSGNLGTTALTIGAGRTLAPGNSPGMLTTGSQVWSEGGTYLWEIGSLGGAAGTAWDLTSINGTLTLLSGSQLFTLRLDALGALAGWDPSQNASWLIATTTGGISGFDPGLFAIEASAFSDQNALDGGTFQVSLNGNSLMLNFTAVPEPHTALLVFAGFFLLAGRRTPRKARLVSHFP